MIIKKYFATANGEEKAWRLAQEYEDEVFKDYPYTEYYKQGSLYMQKGGNYVISTILVVPVKELRRVRN